jgi:hypothetical protein
MVSYYTLPDGCSLHNACFSCPFPDCEAPQRDIVKTKALEAKHSNILKLYGIGVPVTEIMKRTGYKDKSTVYRIIRERRKHGNSEVH